MPGSSWIWKHKKRENNNIVCTICKGEFTDAGSTSKVSYHLEHVLSLKNPDRLKSRDKIYKVVTTKMTKIPLEETHMEIIPKTFKLSELLGEPEQATTKRNHQTGTRKIQTMRPFGNW